MALDATKVRVGIAGELFKAPLGTALPADESEALNAAFTGLGYISNDGVSETNNDSVSDIVAWQNATTVRSATTESTTSLGLTLLETSGDVLEAFHRGSTVTDLTGGHWQIDVKPPTADPGAWVLNVIDGLVVTRLAIGNGEIVERGDISYMSSDAIMYPIVLRCYPDANGNIMTKLSNDAAWATA